MKLLNIFLIRRFYNAQAQLHKEDLQQSIKKTTTQFANNNTNSTNNINNNNGNSNGLVSNGFLKCLRLTQQTLNSQGSNPNNSNTNSKYLIDTMHCTKQTLCQANGLSARDLRPLDGTLQSTLPFILARPSCILVNVGGVKGIIQNNNLILIDDPRHPNKSSKSETKVKNNPGFFFNKHVVISGDERHAGFLFLQDLQSKLSNAKRELPFELTVLEAILQSTLQDFQDRLDKHLRPLVQSCLQDLAKEVKWERLSMLLECKKAVRLFEEQIEGVRDALKELLESDADMSAMYLTHKKGNDDEEHEEVELLLEAYLRIAEEICSHGQMLAAEIVSTEDVVNIGMMGQRNDLLLLELQLGIGTFGAGVGGLGAALLGMNIPNGMEAVWWAFPVVFGVLSLASLGAFAMAWARMQRVLRRSPSCRSLPPMK